MSDGMFTKKHIGEGYLYFLLPVSYDIFCILPKSQSVVVTAEIGFMCKNLEDISLKT